MKVLSPGLAGAFSGGVKSMWLRLFAGDHPPAAASFAVGMSAAATRVHRGASVDPPRPSSRHSIAPVCTERNWIIAGVTRIISLHLLSCEVPFLFLSWSNAVSPNELLS